jgi:hypothetical protein
MNTQTRCHLVYALAPPGLNAADSNRLFNDYIDDRSRGLVVFHDHFLQQHGGVAVFQTENDDERARLQDPGPLDGWKLDVHPLVFSLTAVGFAAQTDFTLERYRGASLEQLRVIEPRDKRFWWQQG